MRHFGRIGRRVALAMGAMGLAAALAGAAGFALFTSTATSQTDTFAAGTVILRQGSDFTCNISNMEPGDASLSYQGRAGFPNATAQDCTYVVNYAGSLNAWVGLSVYVNSTATAVYQPYGSETSLGGNALIDNGTGSLQYTLTAQGPAGKKITLDNPAVTCTGTGTDETCKGSETNVFWPSGSPQLGTNNHPANSWAPNTTGIITIDYGLPLSSGNAYQGGSATITLQAHAVQASNDPLNGSGIPTYWSNQDLQK